MIRIVDDDSRDLLIIAASGTILGTLPQPLPPGEVDNDWLALDVVVEVSTLRSLAAFVQLVDALVLHEYPPTLTMRGAVADQLRLAIEGTVGREVIDQLVGSGQLRFENHE